MELNFEIIVLSEKTLEPVDALFRTFHISGHDFPRNLSGKAGRTANQVFVVFLDDFVRHPWLVVHTVDMPL